MKWYWYLIPILIILILAVIYYNTIEGFQSVSNIQYPFHEVFLVAQTLISETGNPIPLYTPPNSIQYKNQGYTWTEARNICIGYGGDLATVAEVQKAYDNSGNWCPLGWTKDSQTTAYYLPSVKYPCQLTTMPAVIPSSTIAADTNGDRRAFAICNAKKPPEPTQSIVPFNNSRYSMISSEMLNKIMTGTGIDVFPIPFTASQAYYAIDNVPLDSNNYFNLVAARNFLIDNSETVNASILAAIGETDDPAAWSTLSGVASQSCVKLQEQDNAISQKVKILQDAFKDVSGYTIAAVKSKRENADIQAVLLEICSKTNPTDSPACAKLATLDFELFYSSPTHNTLADLEVLNAQLYARREEVCAILHNIRLIKTTLSCPYVPLIPECTVGCSTIPNVYDCSNTTIFDINSVGGLKYSLEQISPLFDIPAYNAILASVMSQLSYIIETPSLGNFDKSYNNMKLIRTAITDIQSLVQNSYEG